jgi:hypothetical protein
MAKRKRPAGKPKRNRGTPEELAQCRARYEAELGITEAELLGH